MRWSAGRVESATGNTILRRTVEITVGDLAVDEVAIITFEVRVNDPVPPGLTQVANQGLVTGSSIPDVLTDDPDTIAGGDPTVTIVTGGMTPIPDLGSVGRLLLILLLAGASTFVIRQRMS